ncbi:MAG: 4Fe-4S ferredoxin N-terminal domain-containing protein [Halovenus sp.]
MHREQLVQSDIDTAEWEEAADGILDDVPYDTELGKEMGRDAIRLARGEISEEAFHEKYHEDVLEEFGVDDRPTAGGDH